MCSQICFYRDILLIPKYPWKDRNVDYKKKKDLKKCSNGSFRTVERSITCKRQNTQAANSRAAAASSGRCSGHEQSAQLPRVGLQSSWRDGCPGAWAWGLGVGPVPRVPHLRNYRDHSLNGNENFDQKGRPERHLQKSRRVTFQRQNPNTHPKSEFPEPSCFQIHVRLCKVSRAKSLPKPQLFLLLVIL